jgi:uncharacterized protein YtpQ (UPF0354 family)
MVEKTNEKRQRINTSLAGQQERVFPILRHASIVKKEPHRWVSQSHTADTVLLYALDHGEGYSLIEERMREEAGWSVAELHQFALENLQRQPFTVKTQEVGPNRIHFISPQDGYAASRILLESLLHDFDRNKTGDSLGVAIPHQDVLIIADLVGDMGANLLAKLTYDFASKGQVPISVLPFFWEDGELVPFLVVSRGDDTQIKRGSASE